MGAVTVPQSIKPLGRSYLEGQRHVGKTWLYRILLLGIYLEKSGTKIQPKEEVFGTDMPRPYRGHSRGYPGPQLRSGR